MRNSLNQSLLVLLAALLALAPATANAGERKDKRTTKDSQDKSYSVAVGDCDLGSAAIDLNINNVRARIYNTGGLFWRGGAAEYEVPNGSGLQSIFASGIWIGGEVDGVLRFAGADYGDWEFWPGPIPESGTPTQESCLEWDRFWRISREDLQMLDPNNIQGTATNDILTWPWEQGAPVLAAPGDGIDNDGDGLVDEGEDGMDNDGDGAIDERDELEYVTDRYDLALGDRPDIIGDQTVWWIMNDLGNTHDWSSAEPIGIEVRAQAFAFANPLLNETTFYKYQLRYKGDVPLVNTYLGLWSDPDLGDFQDDFVGSDPELGLGFVYNGDDTDTGSGGYGALPPALGYDFFQGPLVDTDGVDNDEDGEVDEEGERLGTTNFVYYNNDASEVNGNPGDGQDAYNYMRGIWRNGQVITEGGDGTNASGDPVDFMFPGDPTAQSCNDRYWSEEDTDPGSSCVRNEPADRRFLLSSGPFTIQPGDEQELVFGIIWAQAQSGPDPQLRSVSAMKSVDAIAQSAFNADFELPPPPAAPIVTATPLDGQVILTWNNPPTSNNYLNSYAAFNPFSDPNSEDRFYRFEGYRVYQLDNLSQSLESGQVLATFDVVNNVTTIVDEFQDANGIVTSRIVAQGTDSGVKNSITIDGLTNSLEYYFVVEAYSYNESAPIGQAVLASPVQQGRNRIAVTPSQVAPREGGTAIAVDTGDALPFSVVSGDIRGDFSAEVVNPAAITGDVYRVVFKNITIGEGEDMEDVLVFDVVNTTQNETVFSGREFYLRTGNTPISNQQTLAGDFIVNDQVPIIDGFSLTAIGLTAADADLLGPSCGFTPAADGLIDFGSGRPLQRVSFQDLTGGGDTSVLDGTVMRFYTSGSAANTPPDGAPLGLRVSPDDSSFAFVEVFAPGGQPACDVSPGAIGCDEVGGVWVYDWTVDGDVTSLTVENSTGQYRTTVLGPAGPEANLGGYAPTAYEIRWDSENPVYGHDPFATGVTFESTVSVWDIGPVQPGEVNDPDDDVQMIVNVFSDAAEEPADLCNGFEYELDLGDGGLYTDRIYAYYATGTFDEWLATVETELFPYSDGDIIEINTAGLAPVVGDPEIAVDALDLIGIVPNPYKARSVYERTDIARQARFVNLPAEATIRIFALNGTLVRTLSKNNPATTTLDWDLRTERGLPVASGMYLIHVDVPGVGERVLKFGVIQRRAQLNEL